MAIKFGREKGNGNGKRVPLGPRSSKEVVVELAGTIRDLPEKLSLVNDSQEVEYVRELFGNPPELEEFDGFLVEIGEGEITAVWGFHGCVPWLHKGAYSIRFKED